MACYLSVLWHLKSPVYMITLVDGPLAVVTESGKDLGKFLLWVCVEYALVGSYESIKEDKTACLRTNSLNVHSNPSKFNSGHWLPSQTNV